MKTRRMGTGNNENQKKDRHKKKKMKNTGENEKDEKNLSKGHPASKTRHEGGDKGGRCWLRCELLRIDIRQIPTKKSASSLVRVGPK